MVGATAKRGISPTPPAADAPAAEDTPAEQPAAEAPATEEPATEEPVAAAPEPTPEAPAAPEEPAAEATPAEPTPPAAQEAAPAEPKPESKAEAEPAKEEPAAAAKEASKEEAAEAEAADGEKADPKKPKKKASAASKKPKRAETSGGLTESSIRVDVAVLNTLMNLVGELVLARNQIVQFTALHEDIDTNLLAASQRLNLITTEMQEEVMKTRMQPIGNIWSKFLELFETFPTRVESKFESRWRVWKLNSIKHCSRPSKTR